MRNLLAFLAAVVLAFAGVGWYLGWYKVDTAWLSSGHLDVHGDINGPKIKEDIREGEKEVEDAIKKRKNGTESVEGNIKGVPAKPVGNP